MAWATPEPELVYLDALKSPQFWTISCASPACQYLLQVDDQQYALLRLPSTLAFSYQVLYQWQDLMAHGGIN